MSKTVGDWKRYQQRQNGINWQEGYFDHRIRDDTELQIKADYIRNNPCVKSLCSTPQEWPWHWPGRPTTAADTVS